MFATPVTIVTAVVCRLGTVEVSNHAEGGETPAAEFAMDRVTEPNRQGYR